MVPFETCPPRATTLWGLRLGIVAPETTPSAWLKVNIGGTKIEWGQSSLAYVYS